MPAKTLYICYFGVREPLVQTQVLTYLREIIKGGTAVSLLTFEPDLSGKWTSEQLESEKARLAEDGIEWYFLPYHKRPSAPATAWDVFAGALYVRKLLRSENFDVLHVRAHIPGAMAALARKFSRSKPKILFDIRGFIPEEYTDAGIWPEGGWLYRFVKRIEHWLMKQADAFVILTEKAREILFPESKETGFDKIGRPVEVIPCCVDFARFETADVQSRFEMRNRLGIQDRYVIAYVGAFGGWYLTKETADFFGEFKVNFENAFALILTQSNPTMIEPLLQERGFASGDFLIRQVPADELPKYLNTADAAISFIKRCYSKQAASPTKNAEYLICGLPIIANSGVGDVDQMITDHGVGVLVEDFSSEGYRRALDAIQALGDVAEKCRETARHSFDLESVGGPKYRRIYNDMLIDR